MSQDSSLTQLGHSIRQALTAYSPELRDTLASLLLLKLCHSHGSNRNCSANALATSVATRNCTETDFGRNSGTEIVAHKTMLPSSA
jgi:hypothetical protein